MMKEELDKLFLLYQEKSKEIFDKYKTSGGRDAYSQEDLDLRRWYEAEMKKIYIKYGKYRGE